MTGGFQDPILEACEAAAVSSRVGMTEIQRVTPAATGAELVRPAREGDAAVLNRLAAAHVDHSTTASAGGSPAVGRSVGAVLDTGDGSDIHPWWLLEPLPTGSPAP
jgi:hypothetical protein